MEEDIRELIEEWKKIPQWLKTHLATKFPAHRYEGELTFADDCLIFRGYDIKERRDCRLEIPFDSIEDIYLGFSDSLTSGVDLAFGMGGPTPVVIRFRFEDHPIAAFINFGSDRYIPHISVNNRLMYEKLDCMVNKRKGISKRNTRQPVAV